MFMKRFAAVASAVVATFCAVTAFAQAPAPTAPKTAAATAKKTTPARDPKTGQFVKKGAATPTAKTAKTTPARDPKTGQFIKTGAPAKP